MLTARLLIILLLIGAVALADDKPSAAQQLIPWLLEESSALKGIPFPDVIAATSGKRVLPIDRADKPFLPMLIVCVRKTD